MKLKVTVGEVRTSMSIDGVNVAEYVSKPGEIVNIDTNVLHDGQAVLWTPAGAIMPWKATVVRVNRKSVTIHVCDWGKDYVRRVKREQLEAQS